MSLRQKRNLSHELRDSKTKRKKKRRRHVKTVRSLLFIGIAAVLGVSEVHAASAVAFCKKTGTYAYCYNMPTVAAAEAQARRSCQKRGGTSIVILVSS